MTENTYPVIEGGALPEYFCDGVYRIDDMGTVMNVFYFRWARDPQFNGGMLFRQPVVMHIRPKDTMAATAGVLRDWLMQGVPPPLVLPPSLGGKVY